MTVFYTVIGALAYLFGLALGWDTLMSAPLPIILLYSGGLYGITIASVLVGVWWFVGGEGERRLERVLEGRFGEVLSPSAATD